MVAVCPQIQVGFPAGVTRQPSADGHREGQPRRPRANRAPSLTRDSSMSPTVPQKPQRPRTTYKVSDPPTNSPIPQPRRPPSRAGAPDHPGSSNLPQHNPQDRGRRTSGPSGPPPVNPKPFQRRTRSRSSTRERDPALGPLPSRRKPDCREWLKGNCPQGQNCPFTHDPEVSPFLQTAV